MEERSIPTPGEHKLDTAEFDLIPGADVTDDESWAIIAEGPNVSAIVAHCHSTDAAEWLVRALNERNSRD